eukprot:9460263-Pyramimonas_sp.AAC.1
MSQGTVSHRVGELAVGDDDIFGSVYVTQVAVWVLGACSRIQNKIITRPASTGVLIVGLGIEAFPKDPSTKRGAVPGGTFAK